jgi:hypothetical protein
LGWSRKISSSRGIGSNRIVFAYAYGDAACRMLLLLGQFCLHAKHPQVSQEYRKDLKAYNFAVLPFIPGLKAPGLYSIYFLLQYVIEIYVLLFK